MEENFCKELRFNCLSFVANEEESLYGGVEGFPEGG